MTRGSDMLHFYYDAQGKPAIVLFNGTAYGYLYNLQGDVIALVDGTGAKVVEYSYDAWGKPTGKTGSLAGTLGTVQPFRYRGYVFDEETGEYYLRSRQYRAEWGRFLNADVKIEENLYCYCDCDTINRIDENGHESFILPYFNILGETTTNQTYANAFQSFLEVFHQHFGKDSTLPNLPSLQYDIFGREFVGMHKICDVKFTKDETYVPNFADYAYGFYDNMSIAAEFISRGLSIAISVGSLGLGVYYSPEQIDTVLAPALTMAGTMGTELLRNQTNKSGLYKTTYTLAITRSGYLERPLDIYEFSVFSNGTITELTCTPYSLPLGVE